MLNPILIYEPKITNNTFLENNKRYFVTFKLGEYSQEWSFTSEYSPMYSTVRIIRNDFPQILSDIPDDKINFQIWQNSTEIQAIIDAGATVTGELDELYVKSQYVRYRTEYDLIRNLLITVGTEPTMETTNLGQLQITKQRQVPDLGNILKTLKAEADRWGANLSVVPTMTGATRALTNFPYPLNTRVGF